MITPERLQQLLPAYAEEVKLFFYSYGLADLIIDLPVDHVAIKALNREVYDQYIEMYLPLSSRLSSCEVNGRQLATAKLYAALDAGTLGKVGLLEIMEPKSGAIATTHDLIDHIEMFVPDLEVTKQILKDKSVVFKMQSNDEHTAAVIEINEWGQEVKFTNKPLLDIVNKEIAEGNAKIIADNKTT